MKIITGDTVKVLAGRDKGKEGKVTKSFPKDGRVLVDGVNVRAKHIKAKKAGEKGQTVRIAFPLPVANVMVVCPQCRKPSRIGFRIEGEKKYRVCKRCTRAIQTA